MCCRSVRVLAHCAALHCAVVCNQCACGGGADWGGEGAADFSQYEMRPGLRLVSVLLVPHQISLYLNLMTNYLVCSEDAFILRRV